MNPAPLSSAAGRSHFVNKNFKIAATLLAIFIPVVLLVSWVLRSGFHSGFLTFIANVLIIAATMFAYRHWASEELKILCNKCKGIILSDTPWVCGFCEKPNTDTEHYSFLSQCRHCGAKPKAYKCHHCGDLIFLTEDRLATKFASCLNPTKPKPDAESTPKPKPAAPDRNEGRKEEHAQKLHELEMAKIEEEVENIQKRRDGPQMKSPNDQMQESLNSHMARTMGAREAAAKMRAENAIKFKDNPKELKRANQAVDEWLKNQA